MLAPQLATDLSAQGAEVDAEHPWLGLDFFTEETRHYFYGREDEIAELARRVRRKSLTVLFGQSGLGKTSILRAGLVPRLRSEGYCPVYVRIDYAPSAPPPSDQIKRAIFRATQASGEWTQTGVAVAGESLWEFLHHRDDTLLDQAGRKLVPLLIFDQFEEVFTLSQGDDFGRQRAAEFIADLADLVENRAPASVEARIESEEASSDRFDFTRCDYRVLIALREDYLAHLEAFKASMPSITQNRMRLAPMTGAQALAAVLKPGGALVSEEVAEAIVRFVAGGAELANAEVEPALLSLICRELNAARIAQGAREISTGLLAGSQTSILSDFYVRALADQPPGVHRIIEDQLLTESGFRENVAEERIVKAFAAAGAAPDALATLVNRRLLRIEERLDVRRVELTHDVLCGVVMAARTARQEREAREQAERELAAQRAREEATQKSLARARFVAVICALLAAGAIASAIFGYQNMQRAVRAEAQAEKNRSLVEDARIQAEKLVVYLLDDFYLELEPVGRLDVIGQLARRTLAYYDGLPPSLRTSDSERNRALALVRYAAVLRYQSRNADATAAIDQALAVLEGMYQRGDRNDATVVGLGLGLTVQARILGDGARPVDALKASARSLEVLQPVATAAGASVQARRAYGGAQLYHGFLLMRDQRNDEAVPRFEAARDVDRGIANLQLSDPAAAAAYAEASAWEVEALASLGRSADAQRIAEDGLQVGRRLLEEHPGHAQALRATALIYSSLSDIAGDAGRLTQGLEFTALSAAGWETLVRMDPSNVIAWNNLGSDRLRRADLLLGLGRPREALDEYRRTANIGADSPQSTVLAYLMRFPAALGLVLQADLGESGALDRSRAEFKKAVDRYQALVPAGSVDARVNEAYSRWFLLVVEQLQGHHAVVLQQVPELIKKTAAWSTESSYARYWQNRVLRDMYDLDADSAYSTGDYERAQTDGGAAIARGIALKPERPDELRALDDERSKQALALARLHRFAQADQLIAPVLERSSAHPAERSQDYRVAAQQARGWLAAAVAKPGARGDELERAARLLAGMPAEMRALASVRIWRERVDAELRQRH
jgi:tetratricopeptide (TPR) repeat protein